jgi:hypothetical protein
MATNVPLPIRCATHRWRAPLVVGHHARRVRASTLDSSGRPPRMGVIRGLLNAIGGLLAGVVGLLKGLLQGVGNLLRRPF